MNVRWSYEEEGLENRRVSKMQEIKMLSVSNGFHMYLLAHDL